MTDEGARCSAGEAARPGEVDPSASCRQGCVAGEVLMRCPARRGTHCLTPTPASPESCSPVRSGPLRSRTLTSSHVTASYLYPSRVFMSWKVLLTRFVIAAFRLALVPWHVCFAAHLPFGLPVRAWPPHPRVCANKSRWCYHHGGFPRGASSAAGDGPATGHPDG